MSHSVAQHLGFDPATYDVMIRRLVPHYDELLDEVAVALGDHAPPDAHVLDLGSGSGRMSERLVHESRLRVTLVDVDAEMLQQARTRLAGAGERVSFLEASFAAALPACDAAVAALSLHHVHDPAAKLDVYRNIHAALAPGGVLVVADAFVSALPRLSEPLYRRWAAHLVSGGDSEAEAYARFAEWAHEDRYCSVADELALIARAGFAHADVKWRVGPVGVLVALR